MRWTDCGGNNKLQSPELYDAFTFWYTDAMEAKRAMLTEENASVSDKLANATQRRRRWSGNRGAEGTARGDGEGRDALAGGLTSLESTARRRDSRAADVRERAANSTARPSSWAADDEPGHHSRMDAMVEMYEEKVHQRNMLRAATNAS